MVNQLTSVSAGPNALAVQDTIASNLAEYAQDAKGALSPNTERALKADSAIFAAWCASRGLDTLPAAPDTVAGFVDAMGQEKKPATVRRYVASIAHMHRAAQVEEPTRSEKVRLALKRLSKAQGTRQDQASPISRSDIDAMIEGAGDCLIDLRNKALVAVAYDTMVRRSALVAIQAADIEGADNGTGTVLIRREKNDQAGAGSIRFLGRDTVDHIKAWVEAADIQDGPLFRAVTKGGMVRNSLGADSVACIFRAMAKGAGISAEGLSGHSTRVGAAQDMIAAGIEVGEIMQAGGWKTPVMVAHYGERLIASRGAAAKLAKAQGRV